MGHSFLSLQYIFYVFLHKYGNGLNQFFSSLITLAICTAQRESGIREIRQHYHLELFTGQVVVFSNFSNSGFLLRSVNSKVHTSFPTWSKAYKQQLDSCSLLLLVALVVASQSTKLVLLQATSLGTNTNTTLFYARGYEPK